MRIKYVEQGSIFSWNLMLIFVIDAVSKLVQVMPGSIPYVKVTACSVSMCVNVLKGFVSIWKAGC